MKRESDAVGSTHRGKRGVVILADTASRKVDELGMAIMRLLHDRDRGFDVPRTMPLSIAQLDRLVL